jgi:hypothetical protein
MRKILWLFPVVLAFVAGCSTPRALVTGRETVDEISGQDFGAGIVEKMELHEKSGVLYKFESDKENLYLLFATSDPALQRKIAYFGLTVWIDRSGDRNKVQGFRFPVAEAYRTPLLANLQGSAPPDITSLLRNAGDIELIGIYGSSPRTVKRRDSQVKVETFMQDDFLVYKAVVPYGVLKHRFHPADGDRKMSVGLESGYLDNSARERRPQEYDPRRQDGGMRNPGGMAGRMPGQVPGRVPGTEYDTEMRLPGSLTRPTRLWIELEFNEL